MGEKKKPGRFTLQFNQEDPQQRMVSELLEQQGRHKAQFLTSAVLHYMQNPGPQECGGGQPTVAEKDLEWVLLSIIKKHPQFATITDSELPEAKVPPLQKAPDVGSWGAPIGDDTLAAISETLAAFQQG